MTELVKERPTYGSAGPGQYVDYFVPLSYPADADSNLRFQVELMGDAYGRPDAVSLLIYTGDEIPSHRQTEIFADRLGFNPIAHPHSHPHPHPHPHPNPNPNTKINPDPNPNFNPNFNPDQVRAAHA